MLFNSFHFAAYFLVVTGLYFVLRSRSRMAWLLLASCYFYMAFVPIYICVLGATIVVDYFAGLWIERTQGRTRKVALGVSILANVSVLAVFKYFNFISDNVSFLAKFLLDADTVPVHLSMLLPIGLSFHTFQAMSYTIEVYRGSVPAERNFLLYALYVMFYPQLVAGPIERPQNILPQLKAEHDYEHGRVVDGIKLMIWGFFKKCVIADRAAMLVDHVYAHPERHSGSALLLATLCFAVQIYCDFSGYSDIAIGAAKVLGVRLMKNFNHPYLAGSMADFWRRWHISLSTWFRDYVFIPLGGSRAGRVLTARNLLFTFLLSGLWHGASWNFVIWGGINGAFLVFESSVRSGIAGFSLGRWLWRALTLLVVLISWVFFRADSLGDALYILGHLHEVSLAGLRSAYVDGLGGSQSDWLMLVVACGLLLMVELCEELWGKNLVGLLACVHPGFRRGAYFVLVALIAHTGIMDSPRQFIYFQF